MARYDPPPRRRLGGDISSPSPLSRETMEIVLPEGSPYPKIEPYDGTTDPEVHIRRHVSLLPWWRPGRDRDRLHCLLFPATLKGVALEWFCSLPAGSISSFGQLAGLFIERFVYRRRMKYGVDYLFGLEQEEGERLGDWHSRFFACVDNVRESTPREVMYAFQKGLKPGPMKESLIKKPPADLDHLRAKLQRYMRLEEWMIEHGEEDKLRWPDDSMMPDPPLRYDANRIFGLEQGEDEALGAWFSRFFRELTQVQESLPEEHKLNRREAISAFGRGLNLKAWELRKSLILEPATDYGDLCMRMLLKEQSIADGMREEQVRENGNRPRPNRRRNNGRRYRLG